MGQGWRVGAMVVCLMLVAGACSPHASRAAPSKWGRKTMFGPPTTDKFPQGAARVRDAIEEVLEEMRFEVRWKNVTNVDGEYVFRSARQQKMKITFQALPTGQTLVELYSATDEEILGELVWDALQRKLVVLRTGAAP